MTRRVARIASKRPVDRVLPGCRLARQDARRASGEAIRQRAMARFT